jgi:hypothetical protein
MESPIHNAFELGLSLLVASFLGLPNHNTDWLSFCSAFSNGLSKSTLSTMVLH